MDLKEKIKKIIETKKEGRKVEFKFNYTLDNKDQRAELVRDVSSLANAPYDPNRPELKDGFLILGVDENKDYSIVDNYQMPVKDIADWDYKINGLLERKINFSYEEFEYERSKKVGVIIIHESNNRPHLIIRNYKNDKNVTLLKEGECWTRNVGGKKIAMADDYIEIFKTKIDERVKTGIETAIKVMQKPTRRNETVIKEEIMKMDLKGLEKISKKLFK